MSVPHGPILRFHGHRLEEVAGPRHLKLLRDAAAQQEERADQVSAAMFEALRDEIPAYGAIRDPALIADVQAVSASLVRIWLKAVRAGEIADEDLEPVREGARRRVRQGVELTSLLKAYRVAIRVMWGELLSMPEWRTPGLAGVLAVLAEWALDFADAMSTQVESAYLEEQERLSRESERRRSALLELVLAGRLDHEGDVLPELRRPHAVVVGEAAADLPVEQLDRVGAGLERRARITLWTVRPRSVVAVLPRVAAETRQGLVQRLEQVVAAEPVIAALGLGGDAPGPAQTAASYAEAVEALEVGRTLFAEHRRVRDFGATGMYSILLRDREASARWVDGVLGALPAAAVRPWTATTVESYLLHRGNLKQAARELGVHVNTVKYRISILRRHLGARLGEGSAGTDLLVAIRLQKLLRRA